jgi:hypothetical protein
MDGAVSMTVPENLLVYLADHGVTLTELSRRESFAITKRWTTVFARQSDQLHETRGLKAINKWLGTAEDELILLFLSSKITFFPISVNNRPCTAYRYTGPIIDLSEYNEAEFAVFPETYEWTLIHSHEDYAFGGPYFICRDGFP